MSSILHFSFCIISRTYVFKLPYIYRYVFSLLSFYSLALLLIYLFTQQLSLVSFFAFIYVVIFFKILCSAVPRSLISYRVIISSNDGCGQVKECQWRLTILMLLLTFAQLSASPEKVFFCIRKVSFICRKCGIFLCNFYCKDFSTQWHRQGARKPRDQGAAWVNVPTKVLSTKICWEFFRTEFVFSTRREYSESLF